MTDAREERTDSGAAFLANLNAIMASANYDVVTTQSIRTIDETQPWTNS
jgi:hypothetical protein